MSVVISKSATYDLSQVEIQLARASLDKLLERKDIGFFQLPERQEIWSASLSRASELRQKYSRMIVLGIGGSSLGGLAIKDALGLKEIEFFENVDARDFWSRLEDYKNLDGIHFVVVSKSGKTIETLTQANFINQHLAERGLDFSKNCTVVSELKDNPLSSWAKSNQVPILPIHEDVGGRFSVLTPVGLLPSAFCGVDVHEIRAGAQNMLRQRELISVLIAHFAKSFSNEKWITVFWAYCNRLRMFGLWVEQLWAESLGKSLDRNGQPAPRASTPISLVGANDQHSVLQQISEGARDKFVTFIRVQESERFGPKLKKNVFSGEDLMIGKSMGELLAAEVTATQHALKVAGVPSVCMEVDALTPRTLGELFMLFELVVGGLGELMDIDTFNQPGVELGKRLAKEILVK